MVRTPDGSAPREKIVHVRMTLADVAALDDQRRSRGGMSRSTYIRWTLDQDAKRIKRERGE